MSFRFVGYFSFIAASITVAVLPLHVQFLPPFMILWGLFWLLESLIRKGYLLNSVKIINLLFLLFVIYYLFQAIGIFYTEDKKMGYLNLFGRLSMLLFPLLLVLPSKLIEKRMKYILKLFASSTFIFLLVCFINAFIRSVTIQSGEIVFESHIPDAPWLSYFYGGDLTMSQHPSYISMYVLISAFICFESWFDVSLSRRTRIFCLVAGILLLSTEYFLSSRSAILSSFVLVPVYFIFKIKEVSEKRFSWIWIVLIIIALAPLALKNNRVGYLFDKFSHISASDGGDLDPRIIIWESALTISRQNLFFGVGIGDVRNELADEYLRRGEPEMAEAKLNAHNQFMEVLVENGIIGLILFISILSTMFYIAWSERNILYAIFILMMILFFMFETILYRLAGVSFFSLFSFLLIFNKPDNISAKSQNQRIKH